VERLRFMLEDSATGGAAHGKGHLQDYSQTELSIPGVDLDRQPLGESAETNPFRMPGFYSAQVDLRGSTLGIDRSPGW